MGFLGRVSKEGSQQPGTTVVAGATKIVGDLELNDDFHLDGTMSGTLISTRNVTIGMGGEFTGEISAKKVYVSGQVEGSIDAERLEIVGTGRVRGEIRVSELVIEPGGQFNGSSEIKAIDDAEPRRISHQPPSDKTESTAPKVDGEPSESLKATG